MFCALSGEPPQVPVVSSKSGHVYERRLIEKYVAENGTDPITGETTAVDDLIAVKSSPKTAAPRPPSLTSIPALLHTLQNEWDALVLEQFSLKQQYNAVRQELSHALYQYDAATRVTARLYKERDAAREALASVQAAVGVAPTAPETPADDVEMAESAAQEPSGVLPAEVDAEVVETQQTLSAIRKKRAKPAPAYATPAQVKTYTSKHVIPSLHSAAATTSGISALALSNVHPNQFITGGNDKVVQVYDKDANEGAGKVLASLKGHTKKITHVAWREVEGENDPKNVGRLVISGSADKTVRAWSYDSASGEYAPASTLKTHKGEITGLAVHPTNTILGVASADKTFSLTYLPTFQTIFQSPVAAEPYTSLSIHPDGMLVGLGTGKATVRIFDIRSGKQAVELQPESPTPENDAYSVVTSSFSENGYHLSFSDTASSMAVWDLRKPKMIHNLKLDESADAALKIHRIKYDLSAQFIGIASSTDLRVISNKTWETIVKLEVPSGSKDGVTDFAFGKDVKDVWGTSGREVRLWGPSDS